MSFSHLVDTYKSFTKASYSNNFDAVQNWMNCKDVFSSQMWPALLLFITLSKKLQTKLLELYGESTTIDEYQFVNKIMSLTRQYELNSMAHAAVTTKISNPHPQSPYPNHSTSHCPKKHRIKDAKKRTCVSLDVSNFSHTNRDIHD